MTPLTAGVACAAPDPDRATGLAMLDAFVANAGRQYATTRNYDYGPGKRGNVSMLSPYLRRRLVLEQHVIERTLARHSYSCSEKFIQEVFWRTYFKGWLEHRPAVWKQYCADVNEFDARLAVNAELNERYQQAVTGATGIDCFDAWARELVERGYLHNHARMWFASIWIFTLELPWQLGADFFLRFLLDGDPASNTLSWRWVGGLHTRGKTYLASASNIAKFTGNRFNPGGKLSATASSVEESQLYPAQELPCGDSGAVNTPFALLVTAEDCSPESVRLDNPPAMVVGLTNTPACSPGTASPAIAAFSAGAVADAVERGRIHYCADSFLSDSADWLSVLLPLAQTHRLKTVVTAYAPVGPVADRLVKLAAGLSKNGIRLVRVRRYYDSISWPHATRGYFRLKSKIPVILDKIVPSAAS